MDLSFATPFLRSLWAGEDLGRSECCHCGLHIGPQAALARTFTLQSQKLADEKSFAEKVDIPTMNEAILIYHRHLNCLCHSTRYVAISHIWHPEVAELQYKKEQALTHATDVESIVREVPVRICLGLMTNITGYFEIWHDYISVPQWRPDLKTQIILEIPRIYSQASITVAYLSDINRMSIKAMRTGNTVYERCRAVSNICNAKWFSRVWTAMEFTESRELRTMLEDFTLIEDHAVHRPLFQEIWYAWWAETTNLDDSEEVERMVGMGSNLVPWQLGPLELIRSQRHRGIRITFGAACDLLLRRCVTIRRDFFYALLDIVKTGLTEPILSTDEQEAMLQVAKSCIEVGDFSPLFTIPRSAQTDVQENQMRSCGYLDLISFAMGYQTAPPTITDVRFCSISGNLSIQAENIGAVQRVNRVNWSNHNAFESFSIVLRIVVESTGPNIDAFINTLGGRLYGQMPGKIFERLNEEDRMDQLQVALETLYTTSSKYPDDILNWIAEAMGLSNMSLGNPISNLAPIHYLKGHGSSLHLRDHGAVVNVRCQNCHENFLIRVALLNPDSHVIDAVAYRIPGLEFTFSHKGGMGLLIEKCQIVGRFIWGIPTCNCFKLEEVEIVLHDMPLPQPNNFEYGRRGDGLLEWFPVSTAAMIRS